MERNKYPVHDDDNDYDYDDHDDQNNDDHDDREGNLSERVR